MALWKTVGGKNLEGVSSVPDLDASKLTITLAETLTAVPEPEKLVFGGLSSDHMLIVSFDPATGWGAPEIKPYGPIPLDPMSSCLQYATNVFEGMKAYLGPDGEARLFRPDKNMERLARSADRVALPPFNTNEFLKLIQKLIVVDKRWIPNKPGYSLYIRPTMIGTRSGFGVAASDHALLYVVLSPAGPYFKTGPRPLALMTVKESVRAWPGGTGSHKLSANYAPGFVSTREAVKAGYDNILWMLDDVVTEAGAMNFFVVLKREDGDGWDLVTPELDSTILPGVTRMSCLTLAQAHEEKEVFEDLPKLHAIERKVTLTDLKAWSAEGKALESFLVGTAVVVAPVGRIGAGGCDLVFPAFAGGLGPVASAMLRKLVDIQEGRIKWDNWGVVCH